MFSAHFWLNKNQNCSIQIKKIKDRILAFHKKKSLLLSIRVQQLVYVAYVCTHTFISICIILGMHTLARMLIFPTYFLMFSLYLFVLGRDRFFTVYICFKETLFFNFSQKLFNKYFSLPKSTWSIQGVSKKTT